MATNVNIEDWEEEEELPLSDTRFPEEDLATKYKNTQLKIVRSSVDYSTDQLAMMIKADQINMSPLYQRRNRWDQRKKSRLIESLLLNIPIPPLFLYESEYGSYEVMDGRQRLEALDDFLSGGLALKGLEYWTEIEGRRYAELPKVLQMGLRRRTVGAVILLAESDGRIAVENDVRMVLFERLNTGGVKLNPQELRNALYQGRFNNLVVELSEQPLFRRIWEIPQSEDLGLLENSLYASMADCDLVLRFFAIRDAILGKRTGSLRHLMDGCARANMRLSKMEVDEERQIFVSALEKAWAIFGANCFRLPETGRLSKSLYDASMVAISLRSPSEPRASDLISSDLIQAANVPTDYALLVGRGNTLQAIRDRVALLSRLIFGGPL
jgi:hypothetical protein